MPTKTVTEYFLIEAEHFCAGGWYVDGVVEDTSPILHYLRGWRRMQVVSYVTKKGWKYRTHAYSLA